MRSDALLRPARRLAQRAARIDRAAFDAVGRWHSPASDAAMPRLTHAADHSKIWIAAALGLAATGRRGRRAAVRGLASIAVTSALANLIAKRLFRRRRPDHGGIPQPRKARRVPGSRSFPSGHAASAAAFALAAGRELPAAAPPLLAGAAAVGFSRVYTGVHFPGDVLAGAALGAAVAAAGAAIVPPPVERHAPIPADPRALPARPTGRGIVAVVNPASGPPTRMDFARLLRDELPEARVRLLDEGEDVVAALREAADSAEVLAVSGGDGTVSCAAQIAADRGLPLLVLPGGTYNHFASDLGSTAAADIVDAVRRGRAAAVQLACAGQRRFVNTASIGGYPAFVRCRERWEPRIGKPLAALVATIVQMRRERPLAVRIDGEARRVHMLFIGNGRYSPANGVPVGREDLADGRLDVRLIEAGRPAELLRLVRSALLGRLDHSHIYRQWSAEELIVQLDAPCDIALDGEVDPLRAAQVHFRVSPREVIVYWPGRAQAPAPLRSRA